MSDPLTGFKARSPEQILPNPKVNKQTLVRDVPPKEDSTKLPSWIKGIIVCNVVMAHVAVVLVGYEDFSFMLSDAVLVTYVVTTLGLSVSLGNQTIRNVLTALFGIKS